VESAVSAVIMVTGDTGQARHHRFHIWLPALSEGETEDSDESGDDEHHETGRDNTGDNLAKNSRHCVSFHRQ
jgi:hypothetical protein